MAAKRLALLKAFYGEWRFVQDSRVEGVTFVASCGIGLLGYAVRGLLSGLRLSNGSPVASLLVPLRPSMKPRDALNSPGLPFRGAYDANS